MAPQEYEKQVFINCPFDDQYKPIFEAVVFAVADCGLRPRSALEIDDGGQVRIEKIFGIIRDCKFGIHDISRTELDSKNNLPRFNMPLELGLFLGAKQYGRAEQKKKVCLILDRETHRYQKFISDIAGQDIRSHEDDERKAILTVRNWFRSAFPQVSLPGGAAMGKRYSAFRKTLPGTCRKLKLAEKDLTFIDFTWLVSEWLKVNTL